LIKLFSKKFIFDEINTCISKCLDDIQIYKLCKFKLARANLLVRCEKISNKGLPPSDRSDIAHFETQIQQYNISLAEAQLKHKNDNSQ
jgi:hypothetical protein